MVLMTETYTLIAFLPGTNNAIVRGADGKDGMLLGGSFQERPDWFVRSAVTKHGYRLAAGQKVTLETISSVLRDLATDHVES